MGARFTFFWACRPCGPAGRLELLLTKAGDVETNPGPTTLNKQVWICDICHKQIHVRKQISKRCYRIEHWMHLRCAGIRQAQYTDIGTCHLHREARLTPHTDITPPHRSRFWSKHPTHSPPTPPTPPQPKHRHMSNTPPSYKPISHLSVTAKTLEKSLLPYMTATIPNTPTQHGYKTQHSTVTALHTVNNTVVKGFNQMAPPVRTIIVALDMSKAFDKINTHLSESCYRQTFQAQSLS